MEDLVAAAMSGVARLFRPVEVPEGLVFRPGAGLRVVENARALRRVPPKRGLVSFERFLERERMRRAALCRDWD